VLSPTTFSVWSERTLLFLSVSEYSSLAQFEWLSQEIKIPTAKAKKSRCTLRMASQLRQLHVTYFAYSQFCILRIAFKFWTDFSVAYFRFFLCVAYFILSDKDFCHKEKLFPSTTGLAWLITGTGKPATCA
jgi:hypothetical protein